MLKKVFILCFFLLVLGQLAVISKWVGGKIYAFDVAVGAFSLFGTLYYLVSRGGLRISKFLLPFFLFCLLAGLSLLFNSPRLDWPAGLLALAYYLRFCLYLLAANVLYNMMVNKSLRQEEVIRIIVLSAILISVAGFVQLIILPDFAVLDPSLGWDPHKNRLASTFFDPNYTGAYLVLAISLLVLFPGTFQVKKHFYLAMITMMVALFLTYSRSAWGMMGVVVLIYGLARSKKLVILAIFIALMAYLAVPRIQTRLTGVTDPADSAHYRLISWQNTLNISRDNLFLGVGYNAFKNAQIRSGYITPDTVNEHSAAGSDSSLLLVLATTGVFGLLVFLVGLFLPILRLRNVLSVLVIVPLVLESNFVNSLFYPPILFLWLICFVLMEKSENLS